LHGRIDALGLEVVKKLFVGALSRQSPLQLIEGIIPMKGVSVVEPARYDPQDQRR
jgi:hypothetical protein